MSPINFKIFFILLTVSGCIGAPISERRNKLERRFSGKATWFIPDTGACGDTNSEDDYIVAMNQHQVSDRFVIFLLQYDSSILSEFGVKEY